MVIENKKLFKEKILLQKKEFMMTKKNQTFI